MNRSIYTKLAISNLKNNRKSYIPYVLTAILTVMMYYMMANLAANSPMNQEALQIILSLSVKSVYKELHADHETGAADNK